MKYLIVGIDPGTTTAFAAVSLDGGVLSVNSSKGYSERVILKEITRIGKPVVIATDKSKAPSFVRRIASRLNAKLFLPDHDLGVVEKKELISGHDFIGHERDALAAAISVYKSYEDLFRRINSSVPKNKRDEVKKKLLLDEAINIHDALAEKVEKKKEPKNRRARVGENELSKIKKSNQLLKKKLKELDEKLKRYESVLKQGLKTGRVNGDSLAEDRLNTIRRMSKEMEELKNETELFRKKNKILSMGGVPVGDEVIVSGKSVVLGKQGKKGIISIPRESVEIMEMGGVEYALLRDIEKVVSKKVVEGLISEYRKSHQNSKT